jgi:hypothetical protein
LGEKDLEILFKPQKKKALKRKRPKPKKVKKGKKDPDQVDQTAKADVDPAAGEEEQEAGEEEQGNEEQAGDKPKAEEEQPGEEEAKEEQEPDDPDDDPDGDEEDKPKLENYAPESIIFFEKEPDHFSYCDDQFEQRKDVIMTFFDKLRIESLTIDLTQLAEYEGKEDLRLYIERVGFVD